MSSLVNRTEIQSEGARLPHRTVVKYNSLFPKFKMGLKFCDDTCTWHLHLRKFVGVNGMQYGCSSSIVTFLLYLLFTSSLAEASLRHSSSSLLNLIGLQQSSSVASFASPGAASLSTSSQSLLSATSFNAKLHNGKWQIAGKSAFL